MTQLFSTDIVQKVSRKPTLPEFLDPATLPTLTLVIEKEYTDSSHAEVIAKEISKNKPLVPYFRIIVTRFTSLGWGSNFSIDSQDMPKQLIVSDMLLPIKDFPMDAYKQLRELRHQLQRSNQKMIICMGGFTKQHYNLIRQADSVLQLVVARDFIEESSDKTLYGLCCRKWRGVLDTPQYYSFLK